MILPPPPPPPPPPLPPPLPPPPPPTGRLVVPTFFIYHIFPSTNEQPADRRRRSVSQRTKPCPIMKTNLCITLSKANVNTKPRKHRKNLEQISTKPRGKNDDNSLQEIQVFDLKHADALCSVCVCVNV